ncbi:MAG: AAA family ATPase, partial [Gordonibacter sp.]
MKRFMYRRLLAWKSKKSRLPLILCGARQVGKTYLLKKFGENEYESCAYVNFMDPTAKNALLKNYNAEEALSDIGIFTGVKIEPGKTLVILDEIQEASEGLSIMKAFAEDASDYHIVAAGSYLGILWVVCRRRYLSSEKGETITRLLVLCKT